MKTQLTKIAFAVAFGLALCFAQEAPLAVYTSGAKDVGINKSLSNKLLTTMVQSGIYEEIGDPTSFQDELARSGKSDLTSIIQTAKRYGADYVCAVSITEVFGTYSITARLIKIANSQAVKTGLVDRSLKSLEDLTVVSNELARQLLPASVAPIAPVAPVAFVAPPAAPVYPPPQQSYSPPPPPPPVAAMAPVPMAAAQNQCARTYNINELLSKIKDGFPTQLKDCASKLAKDMLTPASFGGKKLEPKSFMVQCPIDGVKRELPEGFPGVDKVIGSLTNFVQNIMNPVLAGGSPDPKKLISAVASMDIMGLLNDIKSLSANECVVDEPYVPQIAYTDDYTESDSGEESSEKTVSFGIRVGLNISDVDLGGGYGSINFEPSEITGMQLGFVVDFALSSWFHIQPGLMYIQKGMYYEYYYDGYYNHRDGVVTAHYLEVPLLLSLKLSAFRINAGPYIGICLSSSDTVIIDDGTDVGLSLGLGFDIGRFYIGVFSDIGAADVNGLPDYIFFNRTLGFNLGLNL